MSTGLTPWREVRRALDGPRVAADVALKPARERDKYGCVACDSSDALHVYQDGAKCYSCGWSGSVIDLAALAWRVAPAEACRMLAERYGIQPDPTYRRPLAAPSSTRPDVDTRRPEVYGDLVALGTLGTGGRDYLSVRGLSPDLAQVHGIRSVESPNGWQAAWAELERNHGADAMTEAGLRRDGQPWYPWGGRVSAILIPYLSRTGQVEAVRWRRIDGAKDSRYMTPVGGGARIPWGAEAVDGPHPLELVIVEGELDALAARQHGYDSLGLGGATPSREVLRWVVGNVGDVSQLAIWTDSDEAGDSIASALAVELAKAHGAGFVRSKVVRWRTSTDAAETLGAA